MIVIEPLNPDGEKYIPAINKLLPQLSKSAEPITEEEFSWVKFQPNFYLLGALDTEKRPPDDLIGMALIYFIWRPEGWTSMIHCVVVDENYRGKGIGNLLTGKLVEIAKAFAQRIGKKFKVYLTSRPSREEANKMYLKYRFQLVARAEGEWGTNLYKLVVTP